MATRSHVREVVVQLLYAYGSGNDLISKFADEIFEEHKIKNKQREFANLLFSGVIENLQALDLRIAHQLKSWDFSKIGDMERAILRLGVYEIAFNNLSKAIAINEALELAKTFGNEASAKFINGVLDNVAKNLQIPLQEIQESLQKLEQQTAPKSTEAAKGANENATKNATKNAESKPKAKPNPKAQKGKSVKSPVKTPTKAAAKAPARASAKTSTKAPKNPKKLGKPRKNKAKKGEA